MPILYNYVTEALKKQNKPTKENNMFVPVHLNSLKSNKTISR